MPGGAGGCRVRARGGVRLDRSARGFAIGVVGKRVTLAALGWVILAAVLLRRVFFCRQEAPAQPPAQGPQETGAPAEPAQEEVVAAIAAALAYLGAVETSRGGLGSSLEAGPGPWWRVGRTTRHPRARRPA
jgi:hypothetical protein